ncbi:hypothetical protein Tco_0095067, partial [Tanacetum coccineum]
KRTLVRGDIGGGGGVPADSSVSNGFVSSAKGTGLMVVPALETTVQPLVTVAQHQIPTEISMAQNQMIQTCR